MNIINKVFGYLLLGCLLVANQSFAQTIETVTFYHSDVLGSPVAATDEVGNLLWREEYRPYGERILREAGDKDNVFYTGHIEDAVDLVYAQARYYDPVIGRFNAIDPVGFNPDNFQSFNRYAYANNNPYLFVDPDGREVLVGQHKAFINSSFNPFEHAAIVFRPDNPDDFKFHPLFEETQGREATLGGQLEIRPIDGLWPIPSAYLVSAFNYPGDASKNLTDLTPVTRPDYLTDTQFIRRLIVAAKRYNNDQFYHPFPELYFGLFKNSDSYVSGVIKKGGSSPPDLPGIRPGYGFPLDLD